MNMKDILYNKIVRSNPNVQYEYERYVQEHIVEHYEKRLRQWKILFALNWHYRIKKASSPLLYFNKPQQASKPSLALNSVKSKNTNLKTPILPYSDGAESTATLRTPPHILVKGLFDYDIISFDIFDTLLLRKVSDPKDIFMILGAIHNIINFYDIRIKAERDARQIHKSLYGNTEIDITDIYELIEKRTGLNSSIGIETEFGLECELCFANPYMKRIYNIARTYNKRIVLLSDMYWPKEYLEKLLNKNNYNYFESLFVSCDYKGSKTNGILFQSLITKVGADKKIVHIGDNYKADIESAKKYGIAARYYPNVQAAGNKYRENGMSPLIRAAYRGIVNSQLHNGTKLYNPQYEYGFTYGGLFVLGYVNWIHKQAKELGIEKILFLARDGYIYKKIYDKLFSDIPSEYVFWSRTASLKYSCEYSREDFLMRVIDHKFEQNLTVYAMLSSIGLENMLPILAKYKLHPDEIIHSGNKELLVNFFVDNWDMLLSVQTQGRLFAEEYYRNIIGSCQSIAIVDIGWRGDNQLQLKRLILEKWKINCNITCFMAATITAERNASYILDDTLRCYMFSACHNRALFDSFTKNISIHTALFEMFSQAPHPSFNGFSPTGQFDFGYAEVENYQIIIDILEGIEDFCERYAEAFGKFPFLMNISGYDAYIPFRGLTRNYKTAINAIGKVRFQQGVGIDYTKQKTQELIEIIKQKKA